MIEVGVTKCMHELPTGYIKLGEAVNVRPRAIQFRHLDWNLWIPRKAVIRQYKSYFAPLWAIENAKRFTRAMRSSKEREQARLAASPRQNRYGD